MLLHGGKRGGGFLGDSGLFGGRESAPGGPAQAHHLVQDTVALGGEGNGGDFGGHLRARRGHVLSCKKILYAVRCGTKTGQTTGGSEAHRGKQRMFILLRSAIIS